RARKWSTELLSDGARDGFHLWTHTAQLYLARIDLAEGNIAQSKRRLRKVLKELVVEEYTHLYRSSRMMDLLNDLLREGECQIVLDALTVCSEKCGADEGNARKQIATWAKQIQRGSIPKLKALQRGRRTPRK